MNLPINTDITDDLTEQEFQELEELAQESSDKDIMSLAEFEKATQQWRIKK